MTGFLSDEEIAQLTPSELLSQRTPIPTQMVASDEYFPAPQNEKQPEVEARLLAMADELGAAQGMDRRRFFQTSAGMAASFVAMNEVYGQLFAVTRTEAATPALAQERADSLKDQLVFDMHTHFLPTTPGSPLFWRCARQSAWPDGTRNWPVRSRRSMT
jgi:uncharacterized protein